MRSKSKLFLARININHERKDISENYICYFILSVCFD